MFDSASNVYEQLLVKLNGCVNLAAPSKDAQLFIDGILPILTTLTLLNKQRDEYLAEQSGQVETLLSELNENIRLNIDAANIALSNIEEVLNITGPETVKQLDLDSARADALTQALNTIKNLLSPIQVMLESAIQQTEANEDENEENEDEMMEF